MNFCQEWLSMNIVKYFVPPIEVGRGPMISEWIRSSNSGAEVLGPDGSGSQWAFPCAQVLQKDCSPVSVWMSSIIFLDTNFWILSNPKCPSQQCMVFMSIDFDFIMYVEC